MGIKMTNKVTNSSPAQGHDGHVYVDEYFKVQWKVLPTKANQEMEQAGADAAREYLERYGHNNLWVIYEAMVAVAPPAPADQPQVVPVAWSSMKPAAPGAYWIRGNGLCRPALIAVAQEDGELRCNLHDSTTCDDFGYGYSIEQLSGEFEFSGPLHSHAEPSTTVEQDERAAFEVYAIRKGWLSHQLKQRPDGNYEDWGVNPEWQAWKARAALERQP